MPTNNDPTRVDYTPDNVSDMLRDVRICRDVSKGTTHMRQQRKTYLPQHSGEESDDYSDRLKLAVLFNALDRTVKGLTGMVFRRDPVLTDDVPESIVEHAENIDYAGTHIDAFAKERFSDGLLDGHAGILVDAPRVDGERRLSDAEEAALGVRPYWVAVRKSQITSWRTEVIDGQTVLTQLVIHEPTTVPEGPFGEQEEHRYRVYRLEGATPTVEVWRVVDDKPQIMEEQAPVTNQDRIPFAPIYSNRTGLLESTPPLLDLAYTNIAHYQTLADHRYCLHIANVPTLVTTGLSPEHMIEVGPNSGINIPDPNGKAMYLEPSGNAFDTNLRQLQEFKGDMAAMGLAMLQHETRAAETAEAKRLDKSVEESVLSAAARSLQDALENALQFHANFMRLPEGGSISVNRDFDAQVISPDQVRAYRELVMSGQLSVDTLWQILLEGDVLPDDFDAEVERERIESTFDPSVIQLPGNMEEAA